MNGRVHRLVNHVVAAQPASEADKLESLSKHLAKLQKERQVLDEQIGKMQDERNVILGMPSDLEKYLFDKDGFIVVRGALSVDEVDACISTIDDIPWQHLDPGDWWGGVQVHGYKGADKKMWRDGVNLQQIYEAGPAFEACIDHRSWINRVKTFVGGKGTFDVSWGPLFIDENIVILRGPGEAIGLHSGAMPMIRRNQYTFKEGQFGAYQVNVFVALTDIGPGDGGTMVVPGSHKANFAHPWLQEGFKKWAAGDGEALRDVDSVPGAVEVHLKRGDALIFADAVAHGSARRINDGIRKSCVFRYQPSWAAPRIPYQASPELQARLTPARLRLVAPLWQAHLEKFPQMKPGQVGHDPAVSSEERDKQRARTMQHWR